ncbi:Palmitoyl-protein_thioesterase [Hexamita inflata]|uniref:Palmitoyl-protein thioesterase n=1 Tax=Hexamita inflata TaxID=28002 RepID=A0AA86PGA7_9EUKA|nr:Palmitoyl-protein thioesterase [Hexamita inflata]
MIVIAQIVALATECNVPEDQIPIVLVHGLVKSKSDMDILMALIKADNPTREVQTVEILFGTVSTVIEMPDRYIRAAATSIKDAVPDYKCIDIIGHSQGGFVTRAYTQLHSHIEGYPKVRRIYSLAGVQGGYYCYDKCGPITSANPLINIAHMLTKPIITYSNFAKLMIVPTMQWKDPMDLTGYANSNCLLCQINGECTNSQVVGGLKVATGKDQILDLQKFYTFYSPADEIISPPASEQFDFYQAGSRSVIQPFQTSDLYLEDRFGMKTLYDSGRWKNFQVNGYKHRDFVDAKASEFYTKCLKHLIANDEASAVTNCVF